MMFRQRRIVIAMAVTIAISAARPAGAEPLPTTLPDLLPPGCAAGKSTEERLREIELRQAAIEELLKDDRARFRGFENVTVTAGKDGFSIKTTDDRFRLRIGGYVQADSRFVEQEPSVEGEHTFLLRRVRPIFEGTVWKDFGFRIMPDFGNGQATLQDAYVEWKRFNFARIRAGKFKAPFGLERLQSATDLMFVERAFPTSLAPNRDVGLQVSGDLWDGALGYAAGIFNGNSDGGSDDTDVDNGKSLVARVFAHPFRPTRVEALENLGIGVAVSATGDQQGSSTSSYLPSFKTPGQQTFFKYLGESFADGDHVRVGPQAYYYYRSFGLLGEYTVSEQEITRRADTEQIRNNAWQVAASYVLTGEKASYKGVVPDKPFDPSKGQWGAFELAGRVHQLNIDDAAFPTFADPTKSARSATAWAVGLNWYLNKNIKVMADYEQTRFAGGAVDGNRDTEQAVLLRAQVSF